MNNHQTMLADQASYPVAPPRRFLSFTARILGNGTGSGGLHAVELQLPPGASSPWHVHHEEDEWFYVIEGEVQVIVDESRAHLGAGDFAFGPRDVPHGFRVVSKSPARVLLLTVGGRFSDFITENSEPVLDDGKPPQNDFDIARLIASAKTYGQEILGPLPE